MLSTSDGGHSAISACPRTEGPRSRVVRHTSDVEQNLDGTQGSLVSQWRQLGSLVGERSYERAATRDLRRSLSIIRQRSPEMHDQQSVTDAVSVLQRVVSDYDAGGRRTLAAGVKPEMQRRMPSGFDEHEFGFSTFHEFLEHAERAGAITLAREGPHVAVYLAGGPRATVGSGRPSSRRPKIRPDLWSAFTDWKEHWQRAWDTVNRTAIMVPPRGSRESSPDHEAMRDRLEQRPDEFVAITPVARETQLGWMRDFAARRDRQDRTLLELGLKADRPTQVFSQLARSMPGVYAAWLDAKVGHVIEVVEAWKRENGLDVELSSIAAAEPSDDERQESLGGTPAVGDGDKLRFLAHRAIDRMSALELGRLEIPLEYLAD